MTKDRRTPIAGAPVWRSGGRFEAKLSTPSLRPSPQADQSWPVYQGMGDEYLLSAVAAVVLGGTNILGGRGSYSGTVAGVLVISRPARTGRNPATGEAIQIGASRKVAFCVAKELREAV